MNASKYKTQQISMNLSQKDYHFLTSKQRWNYAMLYGVDAFQWLMDKSIQNKNRASVTTVTVGSAYLGFSLFRWENFAFSNRIPKTTEARWIIDFVWKQIFLFFLTVCLYIFESVGWWKCYKIRSIYDSNLSNQIHIELLNISLSPITMNQMKKKKCFFISIQLPLCVAAKWQQKQFCYANRTRNFRTAIGRHSRQKPGDRLV